MITDNSYKPREDTFQDATKNGLVILSQQLCNVANEKARKNRLTAISLLLEHHGTGYVSIPKKDLIKILEEYITNDGTSS